MIESDIERKKEMLSELERVYDEFGRVPTVTELNEEAKFSGEEYNTEFGSICSAFTEADIPFRQQRIPNEELLKAITRLYERFGKVPKRVDMSEFGDYSGIIYRFRFGSWEKALNEAGFDEIPTERAAPYPRRSVEKGETQIYDLANEFNVSNSIAKEAVETFKQAAVEDILPGNNINSVASACFVISCYSEDIGIPTQLIEKSIGKDDVTRQYRRLAHELRLMVLPPDANGYIEPICETIGIDEEKQKLVKKAVQQYLEETENNSNSPVTTVASAIYAVDCVADKKYTQTDIGEKSGVSSMTIRKNYKDFFDYIDIENIEQQV